MKFRKSSHSIKYRIARFVFLGCYVACLIVLTVEAATPKQESSAKSNAVGATIETIINDINGDTAKEILPTGCFISNTKFEYNVGDSTQLKVVTEPSDATYQSYTYNSSDNEVAKITETGEISFLKEGEAIISATNTKYSNVKAEATFVVHAVHTRSFTSTIDATLQGDVYLLETSSSYLISNTFVPSNATFQEVSYEYNASKGFIQIVDDTIVVLEESTDEVIEIKVRNVDIDTPNILKIKTYTATVPGEDYSLQSFKVSNVSKFIDQTSAFTPKVSFVPSYTSDQYRGYTLTSSNTSVIVVNGTKLVPQNKIGNSTITVTSTYNPAITASFTVSIVDRPTLNSVSITKYSPQIYLGNTQKLSVSINPNNNNLVCTKTFSSSNTDVAAVNGSGKVTAKAIGSAIITYNVYDKIHDINKSAQVTINVVQAPNNVVSDIVVDAKQGEKPIIYSDEQINLKDYFDISSFVGNESVADKSFVFYVESTYNVTLTNDKLKLTPKMIGELSLYLEYTNEVETVISKEINFLVVSRFFVTHNAIPVSSYDIDVGTAEDFLIESDSTNYGQKYLVEQNNDIFTLAVDNESIHAYATKNGETNISITPYYEVAGDKYYVNDQKIIFVLNAKDIYTSSVSVVFTNNANMEYDLDEANAFILYMNDVAKCKAVVDNVTTKSNVQYTTDNDNISIKNGVITPKKVGNSSVTVTDTYSHITRSYTVKVRNKVIIDENSVFIISGVFTYDASTNTLTITNGDHVKINYNLGSGSTLKATTYKIKNEKIASIAADGNLTPLKAGKTILTMEVKDEISTHITSDVNIVINRKNFVQNVTEFMKIIRKLVGHFGAFAVLGIFSTLTYFMFFGKKLFSVGVALNFATAFGFAALTEYIQTLTPGRAGRFTDVMIDFYGFLLTAVTITLLVVLIWLIIFLIKKYKEKKATKISEAIKNDDNNNENDIIDIVLESNEEEKK